MIEIEVEKLVRAEMSTPYPYDFRPPPKESEKPLEQMGQAYNRWDTTRRVNPFIRSDNATGFEGFFVGVKNGNEELAPQEVAFRIAELGCKALKILKLRHKSNPGYLSKMWKLIKGEVFDMDILADLNSLLMIQIAQLRMQIVPEINKEGDYFRKEIYELLRNEKMEFLVAGEKVKYVTQHRLSVPLLKKPTQDKAIYVSHDTFTTDELREGYRFMSELGKAGYPLSRLMLTRRPW